MASPGYIDIHTHDNRDGECTRICSFYTSFNIAESGIVCSLGMHPWYLEAGSITSKFAELEYYSVNSNVLAIGECGLDKLTQTEWGLQVQVFNMQIELANQLNKPLIIHCVRAFDEVFMLLKEGKVTVPVIFHGFNKNWQLAEQVLKQEYYLSFGAALLNDNPQVQEVLSNTPAERFFLETDNSGADIKDIYSSAATIRKTPLDTLILQLQKNYETVFKR